MCRKKVDLDVRMSYVRTGQHPCTMVFLCGTNASCVIRSGCHAFFFATKKHLAIYLCMIDPFDQHFIVRHT